MAQRSGPANRIPTAGVTLSAGHQAFRGITARIFQATQLGVVLLSMGFALDDDGTGPCFEPIRRVAQSYLGVLWIAADKRGGDKGALALLRRVRLPKDTPTEVREAITRAAAAARDLRHPNITSVIEVLGDGAELGIAYEHVDGEPLRSLQSAAELRGLSFPIPVSLRIAIDLLLGLETLHQAHASATSSAPFGGLSPDSVLVSRKGEAKLLDALVASCPSLLEAIGTNIEKLGYAAPEQVHRRAPLTARSDLFSVGAVLWELLTGRRLLVGTRSVIERKLLEHDLPRLSDATREGQAVSPALAVIVDAALAAEPAKRPASARALVVQLRNCGHPVASRDELAQFVAELSAAPSEGRVAAARATQLASSPPQQPAPASVSSPRGIRLPMPARARSRAERSPSPAPLVATPRPPISTLPGLPKAPARVVTKAQFGAVQSAARAPAARVAAPAPKPAPPRAAARSAAQRLPSGSRAAAMVAAPPQSAPPEPAPPEPAPPEPAPPEPAPPQVVASPEVAPELEMSEPEVSELEVSEPEVSELEVSELAPAEVEPAEVEPAEPSPAIAVASAPIAQPSASIAQAAPLPTAASPDFALAEEPVPSSALHAFSLPPMPVAPRAAEAGLSSDGAQRAWPQRWLRHKVSLGVLGAALGIGAAFAVNSTLSPPSAAADAPASAADAPASAALSAASPAAAPLPVLRAAATPPASDSNPLPAAPASDSAAIDGAPPASGSGDFHLERLGDAQLVAAFALERRRDVPACSELLGVAAGSYTGNQPQTSRAHFNAGRRALQRGQLDVAHRELCIATAHDLDNVDAQRSLAELALDLGDAARAKEAAERGLARAPKNAELLGVLGDALAILGELPESRRLWLETVDPKSPEAQRSQRLAASYQKAGERSASSFNFARARSYFRRALILTEGGYEASLGLGDALLWLEQGRAGLAWAERVARALPASARAQILLGDAHAKNGELDSAREAWQAARRIEPGNGIAGRRLSRGPR